MVAGERENWSVDAGQLMMKLPALVLEAGKVSVPVDDTTPGLPVVVPRTDWCVPSLQEIVPGEFAHLSLPTSSTVPVHGTDPWHVVVMPGAAQPLPVHVHEVVSSLVYVPAQLPAYALVCAAASPAALRSARARTRAWASRLCRSTIAPPPRVWVDGGS